jgi:mannose-6-phosphate isomerase
MTSLTTPLRFEPFLRPMVWGGRLLERLGKRLPTKEAYGESWEISDHPLARSVVAEGPWQGTSLRSLMDGQRESLLGPAAEKYSAFPWLFKFLDADDWLSVQVHPDENAVKTLWPGEGPKNEAWFVLEAQAGSKIYAGLLPGIGPEELAAALSQGTVADCLYQFKPRAGDFIYLPAGTVHAVGGGVLLAEIQQTSDATFRLFDWNRKDAQGKPRRLHVNESLASIDWSRGGIHPLHVAEFADGSTSANVILAQTPYFHLAFAKESATFSVGGLGRLQAFCVFSGQARLASGEQLLAGQVWLLPAAMAATDCHPEPLVCGMTCVLPQLVAMKTHKE